MLKLSSLARLRLCNPANLFQNLGIASLIRGTASSLRRGLGRESNQPLHSRLLYSATALALALAIPAPMRSQMLQHLPADSPMLVSSTRPTSLPVLIEAPGAAVTPAARPNADLTDQALPPEPTALTDRDRIQRNVSASQSARTRTPEQLSRSQLAAACESGDTRGKECRVQWLKMIGEAMEFLSLQHLGNIATDSEIRHDLVSLPFWSTYVQCVKNYRFNQWSDDTPFIVHNIGHPLMGGITSSIFEQNDPKGRALVFANNGNYWRSRTKAMAFSAVYSAEWKIGPLSEASIGNSGLNTYDVPGLGRTTNETGFQDFIITPVYGMGWNVMEDLTDRFIWPHIHDHIKSRLLLTALFWITPAKSGANILRFKPTYYRDTDR
jgi:hypothetical protein